MTANPAFDKGKVLASLLQFQNNMAASLTTLQNNVLDTISQARSLPSPSALISSSYSTTDTSRCEVAPPADTSYPRLAATCYQEYNVAKSGLNINMEEAASGTDGIYQRCYRKKLQRHDTSVRGILAGPKPPRDCRCQHSPDSAYDSSSNCSWDFEEDRVANVEQCIEEDASENVNKNEDEESFDWDEEDEDSYVPNEVDLRTLSELEPSILFVPHAEVIVEEDRRQVKLREVNSRWNQFYSSTNSCIYTNNCKLCYTKKSVRMRDDKPRVFTFITAF